MSLVSLLVLLGGCSDYDLNAQGDVAGADDEEADEPGSEQRTEELSAAAGPGVDVLFVVDDSCSMEQERGKLVENFDAFLDHFLDSELDWHVGVITTDVLDQNIMGHLREADGVRFLTPETEEPAAVFRKMADAGTGGSLVEGSVLAVWEAIEAPRQQVASWNRGFFREDADFHVVVVSDEDEQSQGSLPYDLFLPWFVELGTVTSFNAVAGPSPDGCSSSGTDAEAGANYEYLTGELDGVFFDICEDDWAPVLDDLGAATSLVVELMLEDEPVPGTLEVWVEGDGDRRDGVEVDELGDGELETVCDELGRQRCVTYAYDEERNSISFVDYELPPGATAYASYTVD